MNGLTGIAAIACAGASRVAVKRGGTVWQWSMEAGGPSIPAQVPGLNGVVAVAAGAAQSQTWSSSFHGLALKEDGTVWAWGDNRFGQLGDGTSKSRTSPVQAAGLREVSALAAAGVPTKAGTLPVSLALKHDGTVWAWGMSEFGRLDQSTPAEVMLPWGPDLAITMSHTDDFTVGDRGVYTLRITNEGWAATAGTVTVSNTLPPGLSYVSGFGDGWACSVGGAQNRRRDGSGNAADYIIHCWNPGPINPDASSTLTLTTRVEPAAWPGVTNLAIVATEGDGNIANNAAGDPAVVRRP